MRTREAPLVLFNFVCSSVSNSLSFPFSWSLNLFTLRGFPPIATKRLGITTNLGAIGGVLWHQNSDSVVICVPITTHKLCCDIYFLCCNRVTLMQPFLGFVLQLVGNSATSFLSCISMSYVEIERCYGDHTSVGCF